MTPEQLAAELDRAAALIEAGQIAEADALLAEVAGRCRAALGRPPAVDASLLARLRCLHGRCLEAMQVVRERLLAALAAAGTARRAGAAYRR